MKNIKKVVSAGFAIVYVPVVFALSATDSLGDWREASYVEQAQLCETIVRRLNQPKLEASTMCICISGIAGDGGVDFMKISETAAGCYIQLK